MFLIEAGELLIRTHSRFGCAMVNLMCVVAGDSPKFSFLVPADPSSSVRELKRKILELQGIYCNADATLLFQAVRRHALDKYEDWLTTDGEPLGQLQATVESNPREDIADWLRDRFVEMGSNRPVGDYFPADAQLPRFRIIHLVILLPDDSSSESEEEEQSDQDGAVHVWAGEENAEGCTIL